MELFAVGRSVPGELLRTGEQVPEEDEIARQAVPGVLERGGLVLLEEEVAHPCEAVAAERNANEPPRIARIDRQDDPGRYETRADEMQHPCGGLAMLREVVRIEFLQGSEPAGAFR